MTLAVERNRAGGNTCAHSAEALLEGCARGEALLEGCARGSEAVPGMSAPVGQAPDAA